MKSTKDRVFVGVENIAGFAYYISKALKAVGIEATSYSFSKHPFGYQQDMLFWLWRPAKKRNFFQKLYINKYTVNLINFILKTYYFLSALNKYNHFFFVSRFSFFKNNFDLKILKLFNKKIHFIFVGCPERDPFDKINNEDMGFCKNCRDEGLKKYCLCYNTNKKKAIIQNVEKYATSIFAQRDTTGYLIKKEKVKKLFVASELPNSINLLNKFDMLDSINIAHLPSNKLVKNTELIESIIREISNSRINYISRKVSNTEVLKILESTHILIDQFNGGHGLLAVEAMSRGCIVICGLSKWFQEDYPEIPIVSCKPENLKGVLEYLINNPEEMKEIAKRSIEYHKKYHSLEAFGNYYKGVLNLN